MTREELVKFLTDNFKADENVGLFLEDIYGAPIEVSNFSCAVRTFEVKDNNGEWVKGRNGKAEWVSHGKPFVRNVKAVEINY